MFRKSSFIIVSSLCFFISFSVLYSATYVTGQSSVDSGEIRWGGSTAYSTFYSKSVITWNELKKINIAPDTLLTIEDLTLSDYSDSASMVVARYGYRQGSTADLLQFNSSRMNGLNAANKENASTHELGHALGLDHHNITFNVMYYAVASRTTLGNQDRADYQYLYGK